MPKPTAEKFFEFEGFWLSKRGDSDKLYITWYDAKTGRTKRQSTRTADVEQAKQQLIDFAKAEGRKRTPNYIPEPHEVLIWDVLSYYLEKQIKPDSPSIGNVRNAYRIFDDFFQEYDLIHVSDLTQDNLDEFPDFQNQRYKNLQFNRYRKAKKYHDHSDTEIEDMIKEISPYSVSRTLGVLRAALSFYKRRDRITKAPYIPGGSGSRERTRWLRQEEFQRLYDATDCPRLKDYMMLAIHTLQRPQFLYDLSVHQIDLDRGLIRFLKPNQQQTKKRRPDIRISNTLMPIIERMVEESESGFLLERYGRPITTNMRKGIMVAASKAGLNTDDTPIDERVVPYTLRHTGATWLAQEGVDLWQIAGMLGHKDTRMVERVYAKHHPDFQKKATETMDRLAPLKNPRASYAPKRENSSPTAMFQIPFKPMVDEDLDMERVKRFELSTPTLATRLKINDYNHLVPDQSYSVTLDSLGFGGLTRQLRASDDDTRET